MYEAGFCFFPPARDIFMLSLEQGKLLCSSHLTENTFAMIYTSYRDGFQVKHSVNRYEF